MIKTERVDYEVLKDGFFSRSYRLKDCVRVSFLVSERTVRVDIPRGFTWNGINLGWILFWKKTKYDIRPALVHDYLYTKRGLVWSYTDFGAQLMPLDRLFVDKLFRKLLDGDRAPSWKSCAAYVALRLFGSFIWGKGKN